MDSKKFLVRTFLLVLLIFILNCLAMKFYWYSSIWYFDMIMHFLGGCWVGLAIIWFFHVEDISLKLIFKIILGVLLIGFFWEVFEVIIDEIFSKNSFNILDTISDIFFDLSGGCLAVLYFIKKIMSNRENTI